MSRFKQGDKVKFLNEKGGGVVVRMIDTRMVLVAIEDGFEIPVLINEIVLAEGQASVAKIDAQVQAVKRELTEQADAADAARRGSLRRFARNPEQEGIYLAFVPHDQQWILTGLLDVVLVNHTPAELLYSVSLQDEGVFVNADYGEIASFSKVVIETIAREDINYWCLGMVQAILIQDRSKDAFLPLHAPFDIKPNRFFKEGSYTLFSVLGDKALTINLQSLSSLMAGKDLLQDTKFDKAVDEPVRRHKKEAAMIDKHRTAANEAVVDLHIAELVDNIAGMSSKDMFAIQTDYFRKALDSALQNDYNKVTFIHGVGNGVLKQAIIKVLEEFEGTESRMASMSKFGVGAIDVIIRDKN